MDDLTKQLAAEYDLAGLRRTAEHFSRYQDREKARQINARYTKAKRDQVRAYEREYECRVDQASTHLAKRRGFDLDGLKKATDPQSKRRVHQLRGLGHRDVQNDHLRRIAVLRNREAGELKDLVETVRQRETALTYVKQPKRLTDQRNDPARRSFRLDH